MKRKPNYEFLFNGLLDHLLNIYDYDELCARLLEIGADQETLYYIGFETENIENGKEIRKEWLNNAQNTL